MKALKIVRRIGVGCLALGSSLVVAAAGDFDPSFNQVGFTREDPWSAARGLAIHSSGEIVTAGYYSPAPTELRLILWRHLPDGQLDAAFGDNGIVYPMELPDCCNANNLAIDNSERIVLLTVTRGLRSFLLYRFNFDGSPDLTFSGVGSTTVPTSYSIYPVIGVAIQPDNKIVGVGGTGNPATRNEEFFVFRLQESGELDPSFAGTGSVFTPVTPGVAYAAATGVAIQPDGKIVVAGRTRSFEPASNFVFALVRYLSNGELDEDFGDGAKVTFPLLDDNLGRKVVIQPDSKIVIAGYTCEEPTGIASEYCYFGVARVDAAGALDPSFGGTGKVHTDVGDGFPYDVALQTDGKIVAVGIHRFDQVGRAANTVLVRYQPDGSVDPTFGVNGISETNYGYAYNAGGDVRIQSDGNIVVAAVTSNVSVGVLSRGVTARYLSDSGTASAPTLGAMPLSPLFP